MNRFFLPVALSLIFCLPSYAGLRFMGSGANISLDPSRFAPDMKERYERVLKVKCVKCHTLERVIIALKTGVAPISNLPFDRKATMAYGVKMMLKLDSNMTRQETKEAVILLNYLLDEAAK